MSPSQVWDLSGISLRHHSRIRPPHPHLRELPLTAMRDTQRLSRPNPLPFCLRETSPSAKWPCVFRVTSPSGHTEGCAELLALRFSDTVCWHKLACYAQNLCFGAHRSSGKRPPLGARRGRRVLELIRVSHPPPGSSQMAACGGVTPTPLGGHSARTRRKVENPSLGSHRRGHPTPVSPQIELIY